MQSAINPNLKDDIEAATATALLLVKSGKYLRIAEVRDALLVDYPHFSEEDAEQALKKLAAHMMRNDFQGIRSLRNNSSRTTREYKKAVKARDELAALVEICANP